MIPRILIFYSILFITYTSHSMEIIKKIKTNEKHKKSCKYQLPIITNFLVTHRMLNAPFPQDVINHIRHLHIQLTNQDFANIFSSKIFNKYDDLGFLTFSNDSVLTVWDDFMIPRHYYHYLTEKQIHCLYQYLASKPSYIHYPTEKRIAMHYSLYGKETYKIFKTIPIEIRRYLTKLPQSQQRQRGYTNTDINEYKILRVKYPKGTRGKFIIPEEKIKHIKLNINR